MLNPFADKLSVRDWQLIAECLCAAEQEEFFPEWEFKILFGISREQLVVVRKEWMDMDSGHLELNAAVIGALNNLLGYPHGQDARWNQFISGGPEEIKLTLDKLLAFGL